MKAGYTNLISGGTATGVTNSSYALDNDTLKVATLAAGGVLQITFTPTNFEFISLFNFDATSIEVELYADTETFRGDIGYMYDGFIYNQFMAYTGDTTSIDVVAYTLDTSDSSGFEWSNYYIDNLPVELYDTIKIINNGLTTAYLGYVWAGDWIDFGCSEAIQIFDNSNDGTTVNRSNHPITEESYMFQSFNITTKKNSSISTLRTKFRKILTTGYSNPRPFLIDEIYDTPEIMLGILSAGRIGYDIIETSDKDLTQSTIEVIEVT